MTQKLLSEPKPRTPRGVRRDPLSSPAALRPPNAGDRPDNAWLQYDRSRWPDTKEKHDNLPYVHKTFFGWYCWPSVMQVHAPFGAQPKLDRAVEEMNDVERAVFEFFSDEKRVDQMMEFFCLEEEKGKDKFDSRRFTLFKVRSTETSMMYT